MPILSAKGSIDMNKLETSLLIGMIAAIIFTGFFSFAEDYEDITDNVFRLHILANSDSKEDQALKLKVRDEILKNTAYMFDNSKSKEQTVSDVQEHLDEITEIAKSVVRANGYDYDVKCEITDMYFDNRTYDKITMPEGNYTALRITIGKAAGHNWWCVMFPPLCLPAVTNIDEMVEECDGILTEEEFDMLQNPENYKAKFYVVEIFNKIRKDNVN